MMFDAILFCAKWMLIVDVVEALTVLLIIAGLMGIIISWLKGLKYEG